MTERPKQRDEESDATQDSEPTRDASQEGFAEATSDGDTPNTARPPRDEQDSSDDDDTATGEDDSTSETAAAPHKGAASESRPEAQHSPSNGKKETSKSWAFGLVGVLVGAALGYVGHDLAQQQKVAQAGSACEQWQTEICSQLGEEHAACGEAKAATNLLTPAACLAGMDDVEAAIQNAREARALCDDLVNRLCAEVGPQSQTCDMITKQTAAFPVAQCEAMDKQFDQVLTRVKQIAKAQEQMGNAPPGIPGHGAPPTH